MSRVFGDPHGGEALKLRNTLSQTGCDGFLEYAAHKRDFDLNPYCEARLGADARGRQPYFPTA